MVTAKKNKNQLRRHGARNRFCLWQQNMIWLFRKLPAKPRGSYGAAGRTGWTLITPTAEELHLHSVPQTKTAFFIYCVIYSFNDVDMHRWELSQDPSTREQVWTSPDGDVHTCSHVFRSWFLHQGADQASSACFKCRSASSSSSSSSSSSYIARCIKTSTGGEKWYKVRLRYINIHIRPWMKFTSNRDQMFQDVTG